MRKAGARARQFWRSVMVKRPMCEPTRAKYPGVVVWALARGASNNSDAYAPFSPSRRDTIDVLCTWPSYERRAASPTRLALGYYTYKHTCIVTIPLFPCTLVVRVLRSCSLHPGGASTMLTRLDIGYGKPGLKPEGETGILVDYPRRSVTVFVVSFSRL